MAHLWEVIAMEPDQNWDVSHHLLVIEVESLLSADLASGGMGVNKAAWGF